ncbi:hypothetical protein D3C85_1881940 [compost metagenome]
MPRDRPAMTETVVTMVMATIRVICTPRLIGRSNTWLRPVFICTTPRPRDWDTPNAVMTTARMSTTWPMGP